MSLFKILASSEMSKISMLKYSNFQSYTMLLWEYAGR